VWKLLGLVDEKRLGMKLAAVSCQLTAAQLFILPVAIQLQYIRRNRTRKNR
jgi:hypothetical protein